MSARRSYVLTPDERGADFPTFIGGTTFFIKLESEVVTWGSYDLVFVNKDESDNYVQCYRRITIYESACQTDIIEETMATELCASPSYDDVCKNVGQQPSIPSPNIFTCGKLGSYNGLDWRTPLLAPPCGGVSSLELTVTVVLPYIMALNCLNSHENLLKTQLEQKFAEIRLTWPKMCIDNTCTNAVITVSCRVRAKRAVNDNQHITGTVVVSSLPPRMNNTNQTLVLSPVEILTPILKESEQFSFPGIGKADLQQAEVTINGVGSCPAGRTVMNNKCVSCGPGSSYNATTGKCDVCPIGYHQDLAEQTNCTACSNGQTTLRQGSRTVRACIEECPAGSFYRVEDSTCAVCPRDYYQPEAGQSFCHACALTKRTRDNGTVEASSCVDDCPDGTEISATNADDCVQCKQNFYRASSINDRCIMCPGENVTLQNASISINQCIYPPCESGTYIDVNTRTCQPCPYGEYQHQEWKTSCILCPAMTSTRSPGANSSQLCEFVCPAGQERLNLTKEECTECKRGYTKSIEPTTQYGPCVKCSDSTKTTVGTGSTNEQNCSITICLAGTQRFEGNNTCGDCPVGLYQDEDLQDSCKQCPNKYTTKSVKSTNMSECIFYCEGGQEVKSAADETCQLCPRGKYSMAEDKLLNCQECKNGKTTNATGSLLSSDCNVDICNQGQIISSGCNDCGFDTFQPVTLPDLGTTCQPCPSGQGTNQTARTSLGDCMVFCNAGQQKNEMTGLCEDCPKGTWNDANTTTRFLSCMPCPTGYTTIQNGSESEQSCSLRNCPPGQIIVNTDQCEPCDFGTYQPLYHQTSCESCDSKENTSSTGAASKDRCQISCPAGEQGMDLTCSVCPDDTSKARSGYEPCIQCEGHFTSNAAKTTCDVPFCDTGAEPINDVCTNCTVGFYKAERGNTSCMPCPTNFTTAAYGSMASSDCDQPFCEKGFFWSSANKMCEKCQEKTYNDRLGQTECKPCPAARTTANVGAVSRTDCSLAYCDAGKFRSDVLVCSDCSHGYYQPSEGSTSCLTCPSGTNTTEAGSVNATQCLIICPAGQFRNSSNKCQPCEVGYYQPDSFTDSCMKCADNFTTTSTGSDSLQQCNIICEVGTYRKTSDRDMCTDCRVASYQNKTGQISCVSCPNGGTTKLPKAASSDLCLPVCGPGTYLDEVKKQCVDCDLGKFSSETGIQTSCTQCPNGKTTETEKSTSAAACTLDDCTKGQKREAGGCALCPIGYYQNETSQATCMKCPTGKTTLKTGATDIILCIKDCPDGQEYIFKTKTCKICQVGFYKNNNLKVCEKCPAGQTTASEGTPCVASHVTERPVAVRTYTMITVYTITTCDGNRNQIKGLLIRFILDALIREHAIYQGICRDTRCSNVITNILICDEIPGGSGRTRRATSGLAQATTQVQDIPELVSSTNATRTSESVLETALYDIVQDQAKLAENGVTYDGITSIDTTTKCVTGQRMVNRTCVDCNAGQYYSSVSTLCVECEKGSYQPNARQSSCVKCPEIKTTAVTGSKALTDCVSPCQFNSAFCQHGGTCKSSETKMYCECPENYKGLTCGEREGVSSSMAPILGGAIGGGVGLFVIVLIIVGCCVCYKNRVNKEKENKAMLPPYAPDDMDYFTPYGSKSSNGGFPTVLPLPAVRAPNPMYLDYQKDWDVFDRSGQYGQYGNDNRSALFERSPRSIENA